MNSTLPSFTIQDSFERSPEFDKQSASLKLRRFEWDLLSSMDGHKTAREIGQSLGISDHLLLHALEKLKNERLIEIKTFSFAEYRKIFVQRDPRLPAAPTPGPVSPPDPASSVGMELESAPTLPSTTSAPAANPALPPPTKAPISFSLKRSNSLPPLGSSRKLMPVMNFVIQRAGGGLAGQIAAYRVLLKVPQPILQSMQIDSLSLADEDYEVPTQDAYNAIIKGVKSVLNISYESAAVG